MDNETKLSKEQINSIKEELASKKEDININDFMAKHLNEKQRQAVSNIVSDPEKMRALMNSPFAKKFMERFNNSEKE